jgi:DNA recombination protein Rad52
MSFSSDQKAELAKPLARDAVAQRTQSGRALSYVESWHVIAEANRIFGFDGWTRETVEIKCVSERERKIGREPNTKDGWGVSYIAKVRVTVGVVVREGTGAGHGIDVDIGQAHESAIKEAESDAMKRALMTFGNPFGLALYDKSQSNVADTPAPAPAFITDDQRAQIQALADAAGTSCMVICQAAGIPSLRELPAAKFASVIKKLNTTIDAKSREREAA